MAVTEGRIVRESARIDGLLEPFREAMGERFVSYRHHVLRVLTYAGWFLGREVPVEVEVALAFHDLTVMCDGDLKYLEASAALAREASAGLDAQLVEDVTMWHHKVTRYRGRNAEVVEACRRADWVDATRGGRRFGVAKASVARVHAALPRRGFDRLLRELFVRSLREAGVRRSLAWVRL